MQNSTKILKDLTGQRFGRLKVLNFNHNKGGYSYWNCICDCKNTTIVHTSSLNSKNTTSCGCYHKEMLKKRSTIHGLSNTRFCKNFYGITNRCNNKKNASFSDYGGRGIKCEWKNFEEFRDDLSVSIVQIIDQMLKKIPALRPSNLNMLIKNIEDKT